MARVSKEIGRVFGENVMAEACEVNMNVAARYSRSKLTQLSRTGAKSALIAILALTILNAGAAQAQNPGYLLWETQSSNCGRDLTNVGDWNRDGFDDFFCGGCLCGGYSNNGKVCLKSGLDNRELQVLTGTVPNGMFGYALANVGDIDGDGRDDILISAVRESRAYLYSGRNWSILHTFAGLPGELFGASVAGLGDVNNDQVPDLAVSAFKRQSGGTFVNGYVVVYSGMNFSVLFRYNAAGQENDAFGIRTANLGDVDNDGINDLLVTEENNTSGGIAYAGRGFVFSGRTGANLYTANGSVPGAQIGRSCAATGDLNGDGMADFALGNDRADPSGIRNAGRVVVFSGANGLPLPGFTFNGSLNQGLGVSIASGRDIDGDGRNDIVIGSVLSSLPSITDNGRIQIYSGANGNLIFDRAGTPSQAIGTFLILGLFDADAVPDIITSNYLQPHLAAFSTVPPATISLGAPPIIGSRVPINIFSPGDAGLTYVTGFSLSAQPGIQLPDGRVILLSPDWFLTYSITPGNPTFLNTIGTLDGNGNGAVTMNIPSMPLLIGGTIYSAMIVGDGAAPLGIRRISESLSITFQ